MADDPGVRRWLIACDESGVHGATHYGFGTLWMKWQRRGDFFDDFRKMKERHNFTDECKWATAGSHRALPFYEELISYFFRRKWLVFHSLVVRRQVVRKAEFHKNDWDLARRKHFTMLLTNKMKKALKRFPDREHEFLVYVDPIASRYAKADEAVEVISNNVLNQEFHGKSPVGSVVTRDSKETPAIQLCDLLLGAVMETWQQKSSNSTKAAIRRIIAEHLGWSDLDADTFVAERKFNIWYFFDPPREERRVTTRTVNLKFPYA
jgi:hypothetical protein